MADYWIVHQILDALGHGKSKAYNSISLNDKPHVIGGELPTYLLHLIMGLMGCK